MPRKERTIDPKVERAAYNLRVAGVSERHIYESFSVLKDRPSYRDLRASFEKSGVRYRAQATEARHRGEFLNPHKTVVTSGPEKGQAILVNQRSSEYKDRLKTTRKVDKTPEATEDLNRSFALAYMGSAGVDPDLILDDGFADSLYSIEEGEGS